MQRMISPLNGQLCHNRQALAGHNLLAAPAINHPQALQGFIARVCSARFINSYPGVKVSTMHAQIKALGCFVAFLPKKTPHADDLVVVSVWVSKLARAHQKVQRTYRAAQRKARQHNNFSDNAIPSAAHRTTCECAYLAQVERC